MAEKPLEERIELARRVAVELKAAATANDVKRIFRSNYGILGWRIICRMFALDQDVETAMRLRKRREE
jgi:hypothetical protein